MSTTRHRRTEVRSPQTNGFCKGFHRTVKESVSRQLSVARGMKASPSSSTNWIATWSSTIGSAPTVATAPRAGRLFRPS